jgi:hypothetical protein
VSAVAAVGAGAYDAFSVGPATQADVEKAAESESKKSRKKCGKDAHDFLE